MSIQRSVLERLRKGDEQAFEVVYHASIDEFMDSCFPL